MQPKKSVMKDWRAALLKALEAPRCLAKTRLAGVCQSPAMKNGKCRMHGGKSTGAPSGERHGRYKNGLHTKQCKMERTETSKLIKAAKSLIYQVNKLI